MNKKSRFYQRIISVTVILLILAFIFFSGGNIVKAGEKREYTKNFISIVIEEGDTLTSIAQTYAKTEADYPEYIDEVIFINNLKSDVIHSGCYLLVPTYEIKE